jgi:HD-GYP domain-containing protein (c-di-GMP phosphodiesterase class II)
MDANLKNIKDLEDAIQTAAHSNQPIFISYQGLPKAVLMSHKGYETFMARMPGEQILKEMSDLEESYIKLLLTMTSDMDTHESYLGGHTERVAILACDTAGGLGCTEDEINDIRLAALLHDIGEIIIPIEIMQKTSPLTQDELALIRQHPKTGADFIAPVKKMTNIGEIIHSHHENYDGSGYPRGLKGEEIPLGGRIIGVVNTYDAITNVRLHRDARLHPEAVAELERGKGAAYDPKVVEAFLYLF